MTKDSHVHKFKPIERSFLVHRYDHKRKKMGAAAAKDTLKERICECGVRETYDMERVIL